METNQIKLIAVHSNGGTFENVLSTDNDTTTFNIFKKGLKALFDRGYTTLSMVDSTGKVVYSTNVADALKQIRTSLDFFNLFASNVEKFIIKEKCRKDIMIGDFYAKIDTNDTRKLLDLQTVKVIKSDELEQDND